MLRYILLSCYYYYANVITKLFRFMHSKISRFYRQKPYPNNIAELAHQRLVYDVINELLIDPTSGRVKSELTEERSCPNCNSFAKELLFHAPDGFDYVACKDCGFIYSNPIRKPEVELMFQKKIDAATQTLVRARTDELAVQREVRNRFNRYLKSIHKYKKSGKLLDVGALTGNFLMAARSFGYNCYGVEILPERAAIARSRGFNVQTANIEEVNLGNEFDVITSWECLEHVNWPKKALINIGKHLESDGILALTVPNFGCLEALILKDYCSWLQQACDHRNMFTTSSLLRMLPEVGFEVLEVDTEGVHDWSEILHYLSMEYDELRVFKNRYKESRTKNIKRVYGKLLSGILYPLEKAAGTGSLIWCIAKKRE